MNIDAIKQHRFYFFLQFLLPRRRKVKPRKRKGRSSRSKKSLHDLHVCSTNDTIPLLIDTSSVDEEEEEEEYSSTDTYQEDDSRHVKHSQDFSLERGSFYMLKSESSPQMETGKSLVHFNEEIRGKSREKDYPAKSMNAEVAEASKNDIYNRYGKAVDSSGNGTKEVEMSKDIRRNFIDQVLANHQQGILSQKSPEVTQKDNNLTFSEHSEKKSSTEPGDSDYEMYRRSKAQMEKPIERNVMGSRNVDGAQRSAQIPENRTEGSNANNIEITYRAKHQHFLNESEVHSPPTLQKDISEEFAVQCAQLNSTSLNEGQYEPPVTRSATKNRRVSTDDSSSESSNSFKNSNEHTKFLSRLSNKSLPDIPENRCLDFSEDEETEDFQEDQLGNELGRIRSKARISKTRLRTHAPSTSTIAIPAHNSDTECNKDFLKMSYCEDTPDSFKECIPKSKTVLLDDETVFSKKYLQKHANVDKKLQQISEDLAALREYEQMLLDMESRKVSEVEFKDKYDVTREEMKKLNGELATIIDHDEFKRLENVLEDLATTTMKEKEDMQSTEVQKSNPLCLVTKSLSEMDIKTEPDLYYSSDLDLPGTIIPEMVPTLKSVLPRTKVDTSAMSSQTVSSNFTDTSSQFTPNVSHIETQISRTFDNQSVDRCHQISPSVCNIETQMSRTFDNQSVDRCHQISPNVCNIETQMSRTFADASNQWSSQESLERDRTYSIAGREKNPYLDMRALRRYMSHEAQSHTDDSSVVRTVVPPVKKKSFMKIRNKISHVFRNYAGMVAKEPPRRKHVNLETGELFTASEGSSSLSSLDTELFRRSSCEECGGPAVIASVSKDVDVEQLIKLVESVHLMDEDTKRDPTSAPDIMITSDTTIVTSDCGTSMSKSLLNDQTNSEDTETVKNDVHSVHSTVFEDEQVLLNLLSSPYEKSKIGIKKRREKSKCLKPELLPSKEEKPRSKNKLKLCPCCKSCKNIGSSNKEQVCVKKCKSEDPKL